MTTSTASRSLPVDLLVGAATGVVASALAGRTDRLLDHLVSAEQKQRDRQVRTGTAHEVAASQFARRLVGPRARARSLRRGRALFGALYGVGWGLVYAALRRNVPAVGRGAGLPFAVPFFLACDGGIAPELGFSPSLRAVPWQLSAKELANHVAWTATAELLTRAAGRALARP